VERMTQNTDDRTHHLAMNLPRYQGEMINLFKAEIRKSVLRFTKKLFRSSTNNLKK